MTALRFLLPIAIIAVVLFAGSASGDGVPGLLTQKTVSGNDTPANQAWLWVRTTTEPTWFYVDRQGVPPSPTTYNFGTVLPSGVYSTGLTYFTLTNYGENTVDVSVYATDMLGTGTTWTLSDTATPGADTYGLLAGLSGGDYTTTVKKASPYNDLKTALGAGGTQTWGLEMWAPSSIGVPTGMSGNVTLRIELP